MTLADLSLTRFCTKKQHQVVLAVEKTTEAGYLLTKILDLGLSYQNLACCQFITYDDVVNLIGRTLANNADIILPSYVKNYLNEAALAASPFIENGEIPPPTILAKMIKLQIIERMYHTYKLEVERMLKRRKLDQELSTLATPSNTKSSKKGKGKGAKSPPKSKKSKQSKKSNKTEKVPERNEPKVEDYTAISLDGDAICDHDVTMHVMFVILAGFHLDLFKELYQEGIEISAIIQFQLPQVVYGDFANPFIEQLDHLFVYPVKQIHLENTILMKFVGSTFKPFEDTLAEFLHVVKNILVVKRHYLDYMEELKVYDFGEPPKKLVTKCLRQYSAIMDQYPLQGVNIPLIIDAIMAEIDWKLEETQPSATDCDSLNKSRKFDDYQVHRDDYLGVILRKYGIGRQVYDTTLRYMKLLKPLQLSRPQSEVKRCRNQAVPCEHDYQDPYISDYVHLVLLQQTKPTNWNVGAASPPQFCLNLIIYERVQAYQMFVKNVVPINYSGDNLISRYLWKEELSQAVLLQLVYKATTEFCHYDCTYSEESGRFLLKFDDNSDDFGLSVRIWDQYLPTPVCLRDFCRFVAPTIEAAEPDEQVTDLEPIFNKCPISRQTNLEMYDKYLPLLDINAEEKVEARHIGSVVIESETVPVYDLGAPRFQLTGASTVFSSYDGVKVIVDNSRFLNQSTRCGLQLHAADNSLYYYTNDPDTFHLVLLDGTILVFSRLQPQADLLEPSLANSTKSSNHSQKEKNKSDDGDDIDDLDKLVTVVKANRSQFPDFSSKLHPIDLNLFLELLQKSMKSPGTLLYKFSDKSVTTIRRKNPLSCGVSGIIRRFRTKPKIKIKAYRPIILNQQLDGHHLQVTLSNGLSIVPTGTTIKQSHPVTTNGELYRIFCKSGTILVGRNDGQVLVMKPNGDLIELGHKVTPAATCTKSKESSISYQPSRVASPERSTSQHLFDFDSPYAANTILYFDGKQESHSDSKIETRQANYLTYDMDFAREEHFFERDDGFKMLLDKHGTKHLQFADGTKISARLEVEPQLIFVGNNTEGWVSVLVGYKMEHPDYKTVIYDNETTELLVNLNCTIKWRQSHYDISLNDNTRLEVEPQKLAFTKSCTKCPGLLSCQIYLNSPDKLVEVCDSYNKQFSSDLYGNVHRNDDYLGGNLNKFECDHCSITSNHRLKLFAINENLSGTVLWTRTMLDQLVERVVGGKFGKVLRYCHKPTGCPVVELLDQKYVERVNLSLTIDQKPEFVQSYATSTILQYIINPHGLEDSVSRFLEHSSGIAWTLRDGLNALIESVNLNEASLLMAEPEESVEQIVPKTSVKNIQSMDEKVAEWKQNCDHYFDLIKHKQYVPYFHSECYSK